MLATMIPIFYGVLGQTYPANCPLGPLGLSLAAALIALVACFVWIMPKYEPGTYALERAVISGWVAVLLRYWLCILGGASPDRQ